MWAVTLLREAKGRVIVCGMGKLGYVGRKIAATLASTGTPANFVHPAEASHDDPRDAEPNTLRPDRLSMQAPASVARPWQ